MNREPDLSSVQEMGISGHPTLTLFAVYTYGPLSSALLKAPIHFPTQSCDAIGCHGKPVRLNDEINEVGQSAPLVSRSI